MKTRQIAAKVDFDSQGMSEQELKRGATNGVFAFCSKRNDVPAIYLKVIPKNAEFPLTGGKNACGMPVVSFAANSIAYIERDADACPALYIMDLAGTSKRRIPLVTCPKSAAFTPDGAWLYFAAKMNDSTSDIFRMKPDGAVISPVIAWKNSDEGSIAFSRDGKSMTFGSNANGKWQLFVSDPDGQKPVCITDGSGDFLSPRYSVDGKHIALLSNKTSFGGTTDLWVYDPATSILSQVSHDARVGDFRWLNNSTIVASCGGDTSVLKSFAIETKTATPFIPSASPKAYSERGLNLIPYGNSVKIIYTREYFTGPKQIFWVNADGTGDECIVNSGSQDWLE
jgi:Tol biopolymer transport system component